MAPDYDYLTNSLAGSAEAIGTEIGDEGITGIEDMMSGVYGDQSSEPGGVVGLPEGFSATLQGWNDDFAAGRVGL